jgi:hypothetical protein
MDHQKLYKNLNISNDSTLIIFDWDDTLYPTSWCVNNNINLNSMKSRARYLDYFLLLDDILEDLFLSLHKLGTVVIITNAMPQWINLTLSILPNTKKQLKKTKILSARQKYQDTLKINKWKVQTFHDLIYDYHNKFNNIVSFGDSEYEHYALLNLFSHDEIPNKYLKSIKFIKSSDYNVVIEQLKLTKQNLKKIISTKRHIHLNFNKE